uniref:Uncharacterized protein n=1 Tax=Anopheles atroparvus TaxID=41427 RepID=A0AAG5DDD5_ANOAO
MSRVSACNSATALCTQPFTEPMRLALLRRGNIPAHQDSGNTLRAGE